MSMTLSLIAIIISSIALIGVALGLMLQARQLRTDRLQAMRVLQLELIKIGLDNPKLLPYSIRNVESENLPQTTYLNLWVKYLETGYEFGAVSKEGAALQMAQIFDSEFPRAWWTTSGRAFYKAEAGTKSRKEFFVIADAEFQHAIQRSDSFGDSHEPR